MNKVLLAIVLFIALATSVSAALSDGLIRDYGMDFQVNQMLDYSGNSNGTNTDDDFWTVNGLFGGGFYEAPVFTGQPSFPIYLDTNNSFTVSTWFSGACKSQPACDLLTDDSGFILRVGYNASNSSGVKIISPAFTVENGGINAYSDDLWHHVAVMYTASGLNDGAGTVELYFDGVSIASGVSSTDIPLIDGSSLKLSSSSLPIVGASLSRGRMDNICVWERPLEQSEIDQLSNSSNAINCDGGPVNNATYALSIGLLRDYGFDNQADPMNDYVTNTTDGVSYATWVSDGKFGGGLNFTDIEYASIPINSDIAFTNESDFTISFYAKTACPLSDCFVFYSYNTILSGESSYFNIASVNASWGFSGSGGGSLNWNSGFYADDVWHNYVIDMEFNGVNQTSRLFVDGAEVVSEQIDYDNLLGSIFDVGDYLILGNIEDVPLSGTLDNFCIWNRSLSQVEVDLLANGTGDINCDGSPSLPAQAFPEADFSADITNGNAPLSVQFTDYSVDATSWAWDFDNDGIVDNTTQNPIYTYSVVGTYSVNLTATNDIGSDTEVKVDYITVLPASSLSDGLVRRYTFDNPSDSLQESIGGYDGISYGTFAVGINNTGGLSFSGAQYAIIPEGADIAFNSDSSFTISFDAKSVCNPIYYECFILSYDPTSTIFEIAVDINYFAIGSSEGDTAEWVSSSFADGEWHHYVMVYTGDSNGSMYIDGVQYAMDSVDAVLAGYIFDNVGGNITLGNSYAGTLGFPLDGTLDNLCFWNRSLSSSDVSSIGYQYYCDGSNVTQKLQLLHVFLGDGFFANTLINYTEDAKVSWNLTDGSSGSGVNISWYIDGNVIDNETDTTLSNSYYGAGSIITAQLTPSGGGYPMNVTTVVRAASIGRGGSVSISTPSGEEVSSNFEGIEFTMNTDYTVLEVQVYKDSLDESTDVYLCSGDGSEQLAHASFSDDYAVLTGMNLLPGQSYRVMFGSTGIFNRQYNAALVYPFNTTPHSMAQFNIGVADSGVDTVCGKVTNDPVLYGIDSYWPTAALINMTGFYSPTNYTAPIADFWANVTSGIYPLSVEFTDTSSNYPTSWYWNFNDLGNSDEQNPIFEFTSSGVYTVTLTATNENGSDDEEKIGYITVSYPIPVVDFTANVTNGAAPLSVQFTDMSTDAIYFSWDFNNDGIEDSTEEDPIFEYSSPGSYTVNLTVSNDDGSASAAKIDYIQVNAEVFAPVANFTANQTSGYVPLTVSFNDTSTNIPTSWAWDFDNDGIVDNTTQNPIYTYSVVGNYTVNLTVSNAGGSGVEVKTDYISVLRVPVSPVAYFSSNVTTEYNSSNSAMGYCTSSQNTYYPSGGTQACQDLSTLNVTTTVPNQVVTFDVEVGMRHSSGGTYDGVFRIYDSTNSTIVGSEQTVVLGSSSCCALRPTINGTYQMNVTIASPGSHVYKLQYHTTQLFSALSVDNWKFNSYKHIPVFVPASVQFTDDSLNATSWAWDFDNDGTIDNTTQNPLYVYVVSGFYDVNLTVSNIDGSNTLVKKMFISMDEVPIVYSVSVVSPVCQGLVYPNEKDLPAPSVIQFNFSVSVFPDFNNDSYYAAIQRVGQNPRIGVCLYTAINSTDRNYVCNVSMNYYTKPGLYTIIINFTNYALQQNYTNSGICSYGQLLAMQRNNPVMIINVSTNANIQSSVPLIIENTGNVDFDVAITGKDLIGRQNPGAKLSASSFKAGVSLGSAEQLSNNVSVDVVALPASLNSNASIYLWLSMPGPPYAVPQDDVYYSQNPWQVSTS